MGWRAAPGQNRASPSHSPESDQCIPSPNRSQLQTPSSYGPVLSPMNKVHGGGINKLPSVNQLVGQPAQHSSSSAPSLGPMGMSFVTRLSTGVGIISSGWCLMGDLLPLPRTWNAEQPPHADQWRNEWGSLIPVHGVGVSLHTPTTLQR